MSKSVLLFSLNLAHGNLFPYILYILDISAHILLKLNLWESRGSKLEVISSREDLHLLLPGAVLLDLC